MTEAQPYCLFDVALARKTILTPWMARLTFQASDVAQMATCAPDQRIKIIFPRADGTRTPLRLDDGYAAFRALPPDQRGPIRTYTIRHLRPGAGEVDIDFVLHGDSGPASRWATAATPGDRVLILAPNRAFAGDPRGYEWRPPPGVRNVLLIGDETALPALAGILEELKASPARPAVQAFIEAPADGPAIGLPYWPGLDLTWLPPSLYGPDAMADAVRRARLPCAHQPRGGPALEAVDIDRQILWDRAEATDDGFYAWVAGEASAVLAIRAFLVRERGLERRSLNLMGYWRRGQALDDQTAKAA